MKQSYSPGGTGFGPFLKGLNRSQTSLSGLYDVEPGPVVLSIMVGGAALASHQVAIGGAVRASGDVGAVRLGEASELAGEILNIRSVVSSTAPMSQKVQIQYTLSGGKEERVFAAEGVVDPESSNFLVSASIALT